MQRFNHLHAPPCARPSFEVSNCMYIISITQLRKSANLHVVILQLGTVFLPFLIFYTHTQTHTHIIMINTYTFCPPSYINTKKEKNLHSNFKLINLKTNKVLNYWKKSLKIFIKSIKVENIYVNELYLGGNIQTLWTWIFKYSTRTHNKQRSKHAVLKCLVSLGFLPIIKYYHVV